MLVCLCQLLQLLVGGLVREDDVHLLERHQPPRYVCAQTRNAFVFWLNVNYRYNVWRVLEITDLFDLNHGRKLISGQLVFRPRKSQILQGIVVHNQTFYIFDQKSIWCFEDIFICFVDYILQRCHCKVGLNNIAQKYK